GVDAAFGIGGGMGGTSGVFDVPVGDGEGFGLGDVNGGRVGHEGEIEFGERTTVEQFDLAAAALFGRGADDLDRDAELRGHLGEADRPAHAHRGVEVVAASMAEAWQGIVFGEETDGELARSESGAEGGLETEIELFDGD